MMVRKDNRVALILLAITFVMLGASFAAVPLYDWFCRVTGFAGTTQVAEENTNIVLDQEIMVRFSASTMRDMPWEFHPKDPSLRVKIGETNLIFYEAYNPTDDVITGTASFNVAPAELGSYFSKIDCFCFVEQVLQPGERVDMPVSFYVDPEMVKDVDTKDIKELTLAYTFHLTDRKPVN